MLTVIKFSGINGFIYYAPILFASLGLDNEMSLIVSGALNIWQLVAISVCFFIIDRVGRRPLAIFGGFASMIPYIIMATLVGKYSHDWSSYPAQGWACIAMACEYSRHLLTSEFPTNEPQQSSTSRPMAYPTPPLAGLYPPKSSQTPPEPKV